MWVTCAVVDVLCIQFTAALLFNGLLLFFFWKCRTGFSILMLVLLQKLPIHVMHSKLHITVLPCPLSLSNLLKFLSCKHVQVPFKPTGGVTSDKVSSFIKKVFDNFSSIVYLKVLPVIVQLSLCAYLCHSFQKLQSSEISNIHVLERNLMTLVDKSGKGSDTKI